MNTRHLLSLAALAIAATLSACGGGSGGSKGPSVTAAPSPPSAQAPVKLFPSSIYANMCAAPRMGLDSKGNAFPDRQGVLADEKNFLRSWIDEDYLWYREVPTSLDPDVYATATDYFNVLKTSELTATGKPKDQFHFTYSTAEWVALQSAGVSLGYGITWSRLANTAPRTWYASMVEPGSPAEVAGVRRGDQLTFVDGVDFTNSNTQDGVDRINAALFPDAVGESHTFMFTRGASSYSAKMAAAAVAATPVQNVKIIPTATGKVGYLTFNSHNSVAERQLVDAFTRMKQENVSDLVIDMRYNGGGLLYMAAQVGYMIAGPTQSSGKVFERMIRNDKRPELEPVPFVNTTLGFPTPNPVPQGNALPWLGLKRVTILTTAGTCSASEAVINGLRGIDVEVNIIGARTCGKPYGFLPKDNCGTTYFAIELKGANDKGFGDYTDGFAATCTVPDDMSKALGDTSEGMLKAALQLRETGQCDTTFAGARMVPLELVRHPVHEAMIIDR